MEYLSEYYHKARKNYGFYSAILLALVLIDVDIEGLQESEYLKWLKGIRTPEVIPLIFLSLIIYFGFRTGIEWRQCNEERRNLSISRIDYYLSHSIGILSVSIFLIQSAFKRIKIGEIIVESFQNLSTFGFAYFIGLLFMVASGKISFDVTRVRGKSKTVQWYWAVGVSLIFAAIYFPASLILGSVFGGDKDAVTAGAIVSIFGSMFLLYFFLRILGFIKN